MLLVRISLLNVFPNPEILGRGRQNVPFITLNIGDPHHFCGRKFVLELIDLFESIIWLLQTKIDNVNLVVH